MERKGRRRPQEVQSTLSKNTKHRKCVVLLFRIGFNRNGVSNISPSRSHKRSYKSKWRCKHIRVRNLLSVLSVDRTKNKLLAHAEYVRASRKRGKILFN